VVFFTSSIKIERNLCQVILEARGFITTANLFGRVTNIDVFHKETDMLVRASTQTWPRLKKL
jgi:hypothetical protein